MGMRVMMSTLQEPPLRNKCKFHPRQAATTLWKGNGGQVTSHDPLHAATADKENGHVCYQSHNETPDHWVRTCGVINGFSVGIVIVIVTVDLVLVVVQGIIVVVCDIDDSEDHTQVTTNAARTQATRRLNLRAGATACSKLERRVSQSFHDDGDKAVDWRRLAGSCCGRYPLSIGTRIALLVLDVGVLIVLRKSCCLFWMYRYCSTCRPSIKKFRDDCKSEGTVGLDIHQS